MTSLHFNFLLCFQEINLRNLNGSYYTPAKFSSVSFFNIINRKFYFEKKDITATTEKMETKRLAKINNFFSIKNSHMQLTANNSFFFQKKRIIDSQLHGTIYRNF